MESDYSKQIKALAEISQAITSDLYLDDILRLIVMVTAKVMDSKICSIMLVNEKKNIIEIRATQSISEDYIKKPPLKLGEGIAGKVIQQNKAIIVDDVRTHKDYKYLDIAKKEGLISLLSVPMTIKGKVIGVLNSYTSVPHRFTDEEVSILNAVANQAAIVIENAKLLVQSEVIKEELETRKAVEKAKGILMQDQGLTEDEAFRRIQKFSMDRRKPMKDIAEAIILAFHMKDSAKNS